MSSTARLKIYAIAAGIKTYNSIIKKKNKKHDKIVLLTKNRLNTTVLISKTLIDWYINHDKFVSENNVLREYNGMKEEIINSEERRIQKS